MTARAVARLSVLSELCLPLVKTGGHFVAMKAASAEEEMSKAEKAISTLGGKLKDKYAFELPLEESERQSLLFINKNQDTCKISP